MNIEVLERTEDPEEVICRAARNDYSEQAVGDREFESVMEGVDGGSLDEKMETLIRHLIEHGHYGPFEHPQITYSIEGVSRSLMAQLTRHRHASFDVQSMRYVAFEDYDPDDVEEMVVMPPSVDDPDWVGRKQKTGSVDEETAEERQKLFEDSVRDSLETYAELVDRGLPPEDARFVLPIGTRTNIVMSVNARTLMHIADMRAAADAQWEIRGMTEELLDLAEEWCPTTFGIYRKEMLNRKNRLAP